MKKLAKYVMLLTVLFVAVSCSEDEPEIILAKDGGPFEISELIGSWEATKGVFYSVESPNNVDIVQQGGSLSLTVQSSGRCTFTIDPVDREPYTVSGEMFWGNYEGDEALVIVWDGSPADEGSFFQSQFVELTATTFNLGCSSECGEYDFDNNDNFEITDLNFEFIRV